MKGKTLRPLAFLAAFVVALIPAGSATPGTSATSSPKLRADLADLVDGTLPLDVRIPGLVAGYQAGEIPFFALLTEPNDAAHAAQVEALGARVLRSYRTVNAFALAALPGDVLDVAALPWVSYLLPVEVITALDGETEVDQTKGTPRDVGATDLWNQGLTGEGVKIAILDTGLTTHPDLDDLDFRDWSAAANPPKVLHARNFLGGGCVAADTEDGHGHGTHVAGIAAGTGEGHPPESRSDNGLHAGIAPGANLLVGKVMTDAGAGINSDLVAAMEAMALPANPANCAFDADIVNMSLGSESRPHRLNTGSDLSCGDVPVSTAPCSMVAFVLNRLAVQYGTLFVSAAGNSGPYIGSHLEAPGGAAQTLSVSASAKDYDVNNDATASGDSCAGWRHAPSPPFDDCRFGGDQPPSLSTFTSHGPLGDLGGKPDIAAPGYNIVAPQAPSATAIAANDLSINTRNDPLYATGTGTSAAAPAAAGAAAILLGAYRARHGQDPVGLSPVSGLPARWYVLGRAALMNTARHDLFDARWILSTDLAPLVLYQARNQGDDPYVGPLGEGAGKIDLGRAVTALRDGVVVYSAATAAGRGTGPTEFQGSWQIGTIEAGASRSTRFVLHKAPGAPSQKVTFSIDRGHPSDGSRSIPLAPEVGAWTVTLPNKTNVKGDAAVTFSVRVPTSAPAGIYSATVVVQVAGGQTLRIPVLAAVALNDPNGAAANAPGSQARITSQRDVYAKDNTSWPSVVGTPGTGSNADWLVYAAALNTAFATFSVYDAAAGDDDETYDLYVYDSSFSLVASTHPFASAGVTDVNQNNERGPSTAEDPQTLTLSGLSPGRYYVAVSRAKVGGTSSGDFGAFVLTLDEATS